MTAMSTFDESDELVLEMEDLERSGLEFEVFVFIVQNEVAICSLYPDMLQRWPKVSTTEGTN
jgi:hypothetical protein